MCGRGSRREGLLHTPKGKKKRKKEEKKEGIRLEGKVAGYKGRLTVGLMEKDFHFRIPGAVLMGIQGE